MTFFEHELRKIVEPEYPDATFVGRACYVRLGEMNRAKLQFVTCGMANRYEAIQMTVLNRNDGQVDTLRLRFEDVLGRKQVNNPNFRSGIIPYIWTDHGKSSWHAYQPNAEDYAALTDAVASYLDVFQEQIQDRQWQQTM